MPLSPPSRSAVSNFRQCALPGVAGASAMSVGACLRFRGSVEDVEGTWSAVKENGESFGGFGEQNVGQGVGEGVEKSKKGGDGRCDGLVRGDDDARSQQWREVLGAMWNASAVEVLMLMRAREQEGADPWRSFRGVDYSIENWYSSCACGLEGVWAGISLGGSGKVMSNADNQNTFKKQVFDTQSLRLLEDCSATSSQPDVLQHWQPYLHRGVNNSSLQSFMVLGWRSIWTMWHYFLLQLMKSVILF